MPSKYILSRLAHVPFLEPTPSKTPLYQEFIDELDVRRQSVALTQEQEINDWQHQAADTLRRAQSKEAKRYVWRQFSKALDAQEEPVLFMAGYQWLQDNREWAATRNGGLLDWEHDDAFRLAALLCAASQLPQPNAIGYIERWIGHQQQELASSNPDALRFLPVQKMRQIKDGQSFYNEEKRGHENQVLWEHVLLPAQAYLSDSLKEALRVPYLPFNLAHFNVEHLLNHAEPSLKPWILSNSLCPCDIRAFGNGIADNEAFQKLVNFVGTLPMSDEKSFVVWDMVHRREHPSVAAAVVEAHAPIVHRLLLDLGMLDTESIKQAMLTQWHKPSQTLLTMELPQDLQLNTP